MLPPSDTGSVYPTLSLYLLSITQLFMATFDPRRFTSHQKRSVDSDADWMRVARKLPLEINSQKKRTLYIPAIPRSFLRAAAQAGDSLELLLIALAEMRMRGISEIAIGPPIWEQIGAPSKRVRTRLLRQIAALPSTLCLVTPRTGRPHLLVAGPSWPVSRLAQTYFLPGDNENGSRLM